MLDLPLCLQKSKSLFSRTFKIPMLRFVNFVMRHGKKTPALRYLTEASGTFLSQWVTSLLDPNVSGLWYLFYSVIRNVEWDRTGHKHRSGLNYMQTLKLNHFLLKGIYYFHNTYSLKHYLLKKLKRFQPLFTFYIKKTDKMRLKHARGKVEKLKVIWKYIPIYKRLYQTMKWLLKDLKFQKSRYFMWRLAGLIKTFLLTPEFSFLIKLKTFIHNFVFQKYRYTLLKTLRNTA